MVSSIRPILSSSVGSKASTEAVLDCLSKTRRMSMSTYQNTTKCECPNNRHNFHWKSNNADTGKVKVFLIHRGYLISVRLLYSRDTAVKVLYFIFSA